MIRLGFGRHALGIGLGLLMLAGCGGSRAGGPMPMGNPSAQAKAHSMSGSSGDLLYVSDIDTGAVYVFSYPTGNLVQTLTGFASPGGLCTDSSGNVYVPDIYASIVYEFAHGGTSPINTLQPTGRPSSCWLDPNTGDLAVTNYNNFVSIYKDAQGSPTNYPTQTLAVFCTYDNNGNLYVLEPGQLSTGMVVEMLPKNGTSFERVSFNKFLGTQWPAGIQWFGNHLVLAKEGPTGYGCCGRVFRFKMTGASGKHTGSYQTTHLIGSFFIYKSTLIATNLNDTIQFYNYPKLHKPTVTITGPESESYGVTVSVAPSGSRIRQ